MDLQIKVFIIMIIALAASFIIAEVLDCVYESKRLGDILGDMLAIQFVIYVAIQAVWSIIRLWNC